MMIDDHQSQIFYDGCSVWFSNTIYPSCPGKKVWFGKGEDEDIQRMIDEGSPLSEQDDWTSDSLPKVGEYTEVPCEDYQV